MILYQIFLFVSKYHVVCTLTLLYYCVDFWLSVSLSSSDLTLGNINTLSIYPIYVFLIYSIKKILNLFFNSPVFFPLPVCALIVLHPIPPPPCPLSPKGCPQLPNPHLDFIFVSWHLKFLIWLQICSPFSVTFPVFHCMFTCII